MDIKKLFRKKDAKPLTILEQLDELIKLERLKQRFLLFDFQKGIYKHRL